MDRDEKNVSLPTVATKSAELNRQTSEELEKLQAKLEQQQAELAQKTAELERKQHAFDELRESAPLAYLTHDQRGNILEINRSGLDFLGLKAEQKSSLFRILSPKARELFSFHLQKLKVQSKASSIEFELQQAGMPDRFVLAETIQAQPGIYQTVLFDVSKRKETELVQKRLDSQILHSQKLELLDRLSGGIAHDFNNILQVLLLQTEQARMTVDPANDQATESIEQICETANRGVELTRRLLAFSRKKPLERIRGNLNTMVEDLEEFLCRSLGDDWKLILDLAPQRLGVWVDPVQIEQALLNLCVNSKDAMPEGGVIEISTRRVFVESKTVKSGLTLTPGNYAVLSIKDSGCGIPDETLEQVLEPYFSTKELGKGTGLGLAIVHSIMRQHSGAIEISHSDENGTQIDLYLFSFHLPDQETPQPEQELLPSDYVGSVLICDDEPTILSVLEMTLSDLGLEVHMAVDGDEARNLINELPHIDLLLSDVVILGFCGREISKVFREKFPESAVVFMSGHGDSILDDQFLVEANATFLPKPFKLGSLKEKLGLQLLAGKSVGWRDA